MCCCSYHSISVFSLAPAEFGKGFVDFVHIGQAQDVFDIDNSTDVSVQQVGDAVCRRILSFSFEVDT